MAKNKIFQKKFRIAAGFWFDLFSVQPHLQQYCPDDKQIKWSCDDWRKWTIAGCEIDSYKEKRFYKELFLLYCIVHIDSKKYAALIDWENMGYLSAEARS